MAVKKNKLKRLLSKRLLFSILAICIVVLIAGIFIFQRLPATYKSVTFYPVQVNDVNSKIYFSDANDIYEASFNGLRPQKIGSVTRIVSSIVPLDNGDILVYGDGRYVGKTGKLPSGWSYEDDGDTVYQKYWIFKKGTSTPQVISEAEFNNLSSQSVFSERRYYTQEVTSGGADIMLQKSDNPKPIKVGHLTEKIDTISPCESPAYQVYPKNFTASFNGDYLLTSTTGGGGTCSVTIHVITSDGKVKFKLGRAFKNIAFIGDDRLLLSHDSDNKSEIVTLNRDGSLDTKIIDLDLRKYSFSQKDVSPSKKLLFLNPSNEGLWTTLKTQAAIYDIDKNTIEPINGLVGNGRWDKNSDTLLLTYSTFNENDEKSDTTTLTLYNPATDRYYEFAQYPISARDANPKFIIQ